MGRRGDGILLKGRTWYLDARIGGKRFQKRLGKGISRKIACELAQVVRGQILQGEAGIGGRKRQDILFDDAGKKFLAWATAEKRSNTLRGYRKCLERLALTFGNMKLSQISPWALDSYKSKRAAGVKLEEAERPAGVTDLDWARLKRLAQRGAPIRINRELGLVKNLYNKMISWNLYEGENPACKVKLRKEPKTRLRWLEREEEQRLLAHAAEPLKTLILVGVHTGLRVQAEALTLKWASVDLKRGSLSVEAGYAKNGKMRSVPLNSTVRAALEQLQRTATGDFVFARDDGSPYKSIKTIFSTACRKAGLTGVTPHTLRHTFCSRLVMSGVDLRSVQTLGGWASLSMIERYSHLSAPHLALAVERIAGEEFPSGIPCRENATLAVVS